MNPRIGVMGWRYWWEESGDGKGMGKETGGEEKGKGGEKKKEKEEEEAEKQKEEEEEMEKQKQKQKKEEDKEDEEMEEVIREEKPESGMMTNMSNPYVPGWPMMTDGRFYGSLNNQSILVNHDYHYQERNLDQEEETMVRRRETQCCVRNDCYHYHDHEYTRLDREEEDGTDKGQQPLRPV